MNVIPSNVANRSSIAKTKRRALNRSRSHASNRDLGIGDVINESRRLAATLHDAAQLVHHTDRLCTFQKFSPEPDDRRILVLAAAGVIAAVRQTLGMNLFDVQLHAGVIVSQGAVAEMQTGEGKTLSVALPAYFKAIVGRGVHVATPNHYLADRDFQELSLVFRILGLSTGLLEPEASPEKTRAAYRADITYGSGHAFGFDYLRDQLTLDQSLGQPLLQRGLYAAIVDEVDHVLIDDATSPLVLSGSGQGESPDANVHRAAMELANCLEAEIDFHIDGGRFEMTKAGYERTYRDETMTMHRSLVRPWHEYVILAIRVRHLYHRDVHYVVQDDAVQIVDESTGRIFSDRTWSEGLHQAVEAKEGLQIRCETQSLAQITRQRFYRSYTWLGGVTGTAAQCDQEFGSVYGLPVAVVPQRSTSRRTLLSPCLTITRQEKINAIVDETHIVHDQGRAVLIGTQSIAESLRIAEALTTRGLPHRLLNGIQDANEANIVATAGTRGAITVATNLAGRGTDIRLSPQVTSAGGLHVIVSEHHALARVDRQLIGRCARCGNPGTARVFISSEDKLATEQAPWVGRAIVRWHQHGRHGDARITRRLQRVQNEQQRSARSQRWRLLQHDHDDEQLLSRASLTPQGCWQL